MCASADPARPAGVGGRRSSSPNSAARTVSDGSSASSVPLPVTMAELRARRRCTSRRAAGPVIHLLSPLGHGRASVQTGRHLDPHIGPPAGMAADESNVQGAGLVLEKAAGDLRCPLRARLPGPGRRCADPDPPWPPPPGAPRRPPGPRCRGRYGLGGGRVPGLRRRWRRWPARRPRRMALTSAWASPARWCQPSPTISPSRTSTQPTRGLGSVV